MRLCAGPLTSASIRQQRLSMTLGGHFDRKPFATTLDFKKYYNVPKGLLYVGLVAERVSVK
jgi:hypothetical protein